MGDLRDLYQDLILDHGKNPRNLRRIPDCGQADCRLAEGYNPLCGDRLVLYVKMSGELIEDVAFEGAGCAIFTSSTSILTEVLRGKTLAQARETLARFIAMLTNESDDPALADGLGKLAVFAGVKEFPVRVKCATLAWRTFEAAMAGGGAPITTE